jgi:hypothetical protein
MAITLLIHQSQSYEPFIKRLKRVILRKTGRIGMKGIPFSFSKKIALNRPKANFLPVFLRNLGQQ